MQECTFVPKTGEDQCTRPAALGLAAFLLRQGDAKVFKKYSQMKLQMKREALTELNRQANEGGLSFGTGEPSTETADSDERRSAVSIHQG